MSTEQHRLYSSWLLKNPVNGDAYRLQFGTNTIGWHEKSCVRIDQLNFVSEQHAEVIVLNNETVQICDVGSTNGTFINGEVPLLREEIISLRPGDYIGFGVEVLKDANDVSDPVYQLHFEPLTRPIDIIPPPYDRNEILYGSDSDDDLYDSTDDDYNDDDSDFDICYLGANVNPENLFWRDDFSDSSSYSDCSDPAVNELSSSSSISFDSDGDDDYSEDDLFR